VLQFVAFPEIPGETGVIPVLSRNCVVMPAGIVKPDRPTGKVAVLNRLFASKRDWIAGW